MLAQRLGLPADARLLIVTCDDLGVTAEATRGCVAAMRDGVATGATLMVPCQDARSAAHLTRGRDVGVHLTLNCEWEHLRWGPISRAPSLCRQDGAMFRSVNGLLDNAGLDDVRRELRAQIEQALTWGVDVTHLDSHMYALHDHEPFFGVYLELAREFRLPVRLSGSAPSFYRDTAAEMGVVAPDHLVSLDHMGSRENLVAALQDLAPGVSEFHAHPSLPSALPDSAAREDDLALYVDPDFRAGIDRAGAVLISYRQLRDLMRSGA